MRSDEPWWSGSARRYALDKMKPAITRFVPGKTGRGLTDDLGVLTDSMQADHVLALDHNYGLWYERRRDDHERIRRMDGEVWAPFYELPFARSGQGTAWDGLSKYDLTKYNDWYWRRLRQFAELADQKGLLLIHQHYFQHNIIEAGAHYADFPWRPANNINNTGFPSRCPMPVTNASLWQISFMDIAHPVRRALHKAYIRQCLNNFTDNNGVLHLIGAEYTGPLHFVQFWLDEIAAWERETGKHPLIGLGYYQRCAGCDTGRSEARCGGGCNRYPLLALPAGWFGLCARERSAAGAAATCPLAEAESNFGVVVEAASRSRVGGLGAGGESSSPRLGAGVQALLGGAPGRSDRRRPR